MTRVLPIPLPEAVLSRGVDPAEKFPHGHLTIAWTRDGSGYVHSQLGVLTKQGELAATIVTTLDAEFSITGLLFLDELHRELTMTADRFAVCDMVAPLGITAHDEIVFPTTSGATIVYDATLRERLASMPRGSGASQVVGVPGGLVALRGESIAVATGEPAMRAGVPELRALTTREAAGFDGRHAYHGRLVALDTDAILATTFAYPSRGNRRSPSQFRFSIVRGNGAITHLPLGAADTPYGKTLHDASYCAHRGLGVFVTSSDTALNAFDRDGQRVLRVPFVEDKRLTAIAALDLFDVSPRGELVLIHRKHHLLVVTEPLASLDDVEPALVAAAAVLRSEHARLKQALLVDTDHWFTWEAHTPNVVAKVTAKKRKPEVAPAAPAPAAVERVALTPREAMVHAPGDLDTLAVYADSIAAAEPALAEYIQLGIRLERGGADAAERASWLVRRDALRDGHMRGWLATWNDPNPLFDERFDARAGLPQSVRFEHLPPALDKLEAQLAQLPIGCFSFSGIGTKGIQQLATVPALRRIVQLIISARSKTLGKQFVAWLAAQGLDNICELMLYGVELTGTGLRALADSMPRLVKLGLVDTKLTAEAMDYLDTSAIAPRLEHLELASSPIGGRGLAGLARYTRLARLEVRRIDLREVELPATPPTTAITELDIADNTLGRAGIAWFLAAAPRLRVLEVAALDTAALALLGDASELDTLSLSLVGRPAIVAFVDDVLPRLGKLAKLKLPSHDTVEIIERLPREQRFTSLSLGPVTLADIDALARRPGTEALEELTVGAGFDNTCARVLAASPRLASLRMLSISSSELGESGIARLLAGKWQLESLHLTYARIDDIDELEPPVGRPFALTLYNCDITPERLVRLRRRFGGRIPT